MASRTPVGALRHAIGLLAVVLIVAACGGDAGETGQGKSGTDTKKDSSQEAPMELTALLPFPSGINFYPLFVAQERGYFGDKVSLNVEAADGSGAALQQLLAGNADMCLCGPGTALRGVAKGEDLVSLYTLYQKDVFSLVAPKGSPVQSVEDLRGKTIGVDAREGGAESWLVPLLSAAGLKLDEDYKITAVGPGAAPISAFNGKEIDAYAGAFVDHAILRLRGFELEQVDIPGSDIFFDSGVWMRADFVKENPEVVQALGRGLAMATAWGMKKENAEGVLDITKKKYPEEAEDKEFALALLDETNVLYELPEQAEGRWGYSVPERASALIDALVEQGALEKEVDPSVFINEYVDAYNDFEESDL